MKKTVQERVPRGHLVHALSQRRVNMVSDTMMVTWWLSFKTLTFLSVDLSTPYTEDLHHILVAGGIYRTVYIYVCVYICIYVNVLAGVLKVGTLITDSWLSGFESLSYNRDHEANQTTRGSPWSLVPVFTSSLMIGGISKAIPGKESLYSRLFSHVFLLKNIFLTFIRKLIQR